MEDKKKVVIGIGSNLGDRKENIDRAILELEKVFNSKVKRSPVYQTEAWGFESENIFLNCCVIIKTKLSAEEVLKETQSIELKIGRVKKSKNEIYQSRVIDLDILYYEDTVLISENLTIPHPLIYHRAFVVRPLSDICPELIDPVKKVSITQLLAVCNDRSEVLLYED